MLAVSGRLKTCQLLFKIWHVIVLAVFRMFRVHCFSVPGPPTDLRAEVTQSQQNSAQTVNVRLTWKPPTHVNGVIRSYEISLSTNSSLPDRLWTNIVSNGMITIAHLTFSA